MAIVMLVPILIGVLILILFPLPILILIPILVLVPILVLIFVIAVVGAADFGSAVQQLGFSQYTRFMPDIVVLLEKGRIQVLFHEGGEWRYNIAWVWITSYFRSTLLDSLRANSDMWIVSLVKTMASTGRSNQTKPSARLVH